MLDLIIRNKRVLENAIYYLLSINYDFLIFRNLWFLRVSIEHTYETQLGLRPHHESQCNAFGGPRALAIS